MRQEKFVYNKQTLRYEKVETPLKARLLTIGFYLASVVVVSFLVGSLMYAYLPSPRERMLEKELTSMSQQYTLLEERMEIIAGVLGDMRERDANVFRMTFGMEPVDDFEWNGGIGGHDAYNNLRTFDSGRLMSSTTSKLDELERQVVVQSRSLDDIINIAKDREKQISHTPSIKPIRADQLNRSINLLSGFGMRRHPIHKVVKMHAGIDFSAPQGTPINATGDGKVTRIKYDKRGYGTNVMIDHGYGFTTLYAHMRDVDVEIGEKVHKGQKIGTVGNTGTSTAPHLHYEVRQNGKPVNPIHYCMDGLSPEQYQQLVESASTANQSFD